jgi:hypothetical protein
MASLAIVGEQSFHCYSTGESKAQVDRALRRAMLQVGGFAAHINIEQGTARSTLLRRGDEFLEARIIPERIEHGIEPEQRRSERQVSCN